MKENLKTFVSKFITDAVFGGIGGTLIHILKALKPHIAFSLLFGTRFTVAYITGNYKYEKEVNHAR